MSTAFKRVDLATVPWLDVLATLGLTEEQLSGSGASCPVCGGNDRFTFDDRKGNGDWICRKHNGGNPASGGGINLVMELQVLDFVHALDFVREWMGDCSRQVTAPIAARPEKKNETKKVFFEKLTRAFYETGDELVAGSPVASYILARVPGLDIQRLKNLRQNKLLYTDKGKPDKAKSGTRKVFGDFYAMVGRYQNPEGKMATTHRTYLHPTKSAKLEVYRDGSSDPLDPRKQGASLLDVHGGAIRLLDPTDGVVGVAEGIETALAAFMLTGVPVWSCLNRVLLAHFIVPPGLGIHTVHIFADYDHVDINTGGSPGMVSAIDLSKTLKSKGFKVVMHRPSKIGTDFADEWLMKVQRGGRLRVA